MNLYPSIYIRSRILPCIGLCLLVLTGIATRRTVFNAQSAHPALIPFTLESALHYRRIRSVFLGSGIPEVDLQIQVPGGIRTFETDTVGSELVIGRMARFLPDGLTLPERVRWIHVIWFSLGIAWLALWVRWLSGSWLGAWISGLFYSVALSSVIRSTGQELSHENIAIPFLLAHLALDARASASVRPGRRRRVRWTSALALGLALCTWDMIQYYIGLRSLWLLLSACFARPLPRSSIIDWVPEFLILLVIGTVHPYFRFHAFLLSPVLGFYLTAIGIHLLRLSGFTATGPHRLLACIAGLALAFLPSHLGEFTDRYGHFGRLFWAKIRFLNLKPADPSLLDFNQRIMWTPALHSATSALILQLFPCLLVLTVITAALYYSANKRRAEMGASSDICTPLTFYFTVSLLAFILFVRFHVYTSLFCVALLGVWSANLLRRRDPVRWILGILLGICLLGEASHTLRNAKKWGRNSSYGEIRELAEWLKEWAPGETVLANFGVSAFVLTYGGNPIVLHPKFESSEIRNRVEEYGTLLFKGTEEKFADWALRHGSQIFVYSAGEFSRRTPEYQMRYMVDALTPPPEAPARCFEWNPQTMTRFKFLWGNAQYKVYRLLPAMEAARSGSVD